MICFHKNCRKWYCKHILHLLFPVSPQSSLIFSLCLNELCALFRIKTMPSFFKYTYISVFLGGRKNSKQPSFFLSTKGQHIASCALHVHFLCTWKHNFMIQTLFESSGINPVLGTEWRQWYLVQNCWPSTVEMLPLYQALIVRELLAAHLPDLWKRHEFSSVMSWWCGCHRYKQPAVWEGNTVLYSHWSLIAKLKGIRGHIECLT